MPCLLPACAVITFPLAEILNLFFAELFVLSFGIIDRGYTENDKNLQPILSPIKAELPLSFVCHQILDVIQLYQFLSCLPLFWTLIHFQGENVEVLDL